MLTGGRALSTSAYWARVVGGQGLTATHGDTAGGWYRGRGVSGLVLVSVHRRDREGPPAHGLAARLPQERQI